MVETITKENFKEKVLEAREPVLVELWAPWCVYCRRLSPALDRLADKLEGELTVGKINVDEQPELGQQLDDSTIPTLYLYQGGAHGGKLVAPASQAQVEEWIAGQTAGAGV